MQGTLLVEASYVTLSSGSSVRAHLHSGSAIFIEPTYANLLKSQSSVGAALGKRAEPPVSVPA